VHCEWVIMYIVRVTRMGEYIYTYMLVRCCLLCTVL
jgi:hypothetical protein